MKTKTENIYIEENGDYLKNNPSWHIEDSSWKAKQVIKMLTRNQIDPKSIADIGCGAGEVLNQLYGLLPSDIYFTGYDISKDAINLAEKREKERLKIKHENLLDKNEKFDLLLMIDTFEHVDDYLGFLRLSKDKARKTIFHIPLDITVWAIFNNDFMANRKSLGHLHYFTKETALATLMDAGYEIIDYFYTDWFFELRSRKKLRSKIKYFICKILYRINKDIMIKILGGASLLVLTNNETDNKYP